VKVTSPSPSFAQPYEILGVTKKKYVEWMDAPPQSQTTACGGAAVEITTKPGRSSLPDKAPATLFRDMLSNGMSWAAPPPHAGRSINIEGFLLLAIICIYIYIYE
jgi:hypothetical protein